MLTFSEFQNSRKVCHAPSDDDFDDLFGHAATVGFVYDTNCYIAIKDDGSFYTVVTVDELVSRDLNEVELFLYNEHYIHEGRF